VPRGMGPPTAVAPGETWLAACRETAALGWDVAGRLAELHDPRRWRRWWLVDLTQMTAEAMTSPALLSLVKFNLALLAPRGR